jgi:hypothetical protein
MLRATVIDLQREIVTKDNEVKETNNLLHKEKNHSQSLKDEADFLMSQLTEQKRLNNILKLAINRITEELKLKEKLIRIHNLSQT